MAPNNLNVAGIATAVAVVIIVFAVGNSVYNLFFHPLRKFPGPILYRASRLPWIYRLITGGLAQDVLRLTDKYGPIVRIAPNELAFIDPQAWRDIYGHRTGSLLGADEMSKFRVFYRTKGIPPSIINEDRDNHTLLRRQLSHGFSEKSMREQESIIGGYVDLLVKRLKEHCVETKLGEKPVPKPLDMRAWYNWATFDIIGDLAFGEPFGCLENAYYHPWVKVITGTLQAGAYIISLKYLGLDGVITTATRLLAKSRRQHSKNTREKLARRLAIDAERPDLIEGLLKKKDDWNLDFGRLQINSSILIIAGSETTATLLSGLTFLLLTNPDAMKRLTDEVRSTFKSEEEITMTSVGTLSYMLACLNEALRRYPPVAFGLPRTVPKGGANIADTFVPENTIVAVWQYAAYHSKRNWSDPLSFKPERFLEGEKNETDKLDALQPFSIGPRNCIGRNLAYAEMRLILARIVFNFDMRLADPNSKWLNQRVYILWDKPELDVILTPVR